MKKTNGNWIEEYKGYWVNKATKYVVKEIGRNEGEEWVFLDDRGMMISCEWKDNKEGCMEEADFIYENEKVNGRFILA